MPVCKTDLEVRLFDALKRITRYETAERLLKYGEAAYGISGHEALEMAYENVIEEAKRGIRGVRARKPRVNLAEQVRVLGADSLLPDWKP